MSTESVAKTKVNLHPPFVTRLTAPLLANCAVVALLLGAVNYVTAPIIDAMQAEKTKAAMAQVLAADDYLPVEGSFDGVVAMYEAVSGGQTIGYVAEVASNGFGGAISMVVGVDVNGAVTGVAVTNDKETANIGTKVTRDQSVLDRFVGMSQAAGQITVNTGANAFDGVSGATVSSRGVTGGVNAALNAVGSLK